MIARFRLPALLTAVALLGLACAETEPDPVAFSGDLTAGMSASQGAARGPMSFQERAAAPAPQPR